MYQSFIGLEIHIQLLTSTKVFCGCRAAFGDEPNTNVCPVCMGYPGVLPALNDTAIRYGYLVAKALQCTLSPAAIFERKNYFYPDLPKNFQTSMFASPIGTDGHVELEFRKQKKRIRIKEVHLEEDAGKMIHAGDMSLLDYNRAGTPLLEIVTEPDLEIGEEAELLLQNFRRMVRYLGVCDGNMEEGSMRCDANVSVNLAGKGLGRKVEIKNLNSSRFVRKAIAFEIDRQQDILERGGTVIQETRLWNENRDSTESMRQKESSNDYRFFPEPDLPPFRPDTAFLQGIEALMVELPGARKERFQNVFGLSGFQAEYLTEEKPRADFFERTVALGADPVSAATWLAGDVSKLLNRTGLDVDRSPLSPERFSELLLLLDEGRIHGKLAKQTLEAVFEEDRDPAVIIRDKGWEQITDRKELGTVIDGVLADNPRAVQEIRAGDSRPMGFLVGKIMQVTSGRAEPKIVQDLLKARLSVSLIHVLFFGGAISGERSADGRIASARPVELKSLLDGGTDLPSDIRFEEVEVSRMLSEEVTPGDWALLVTRVCERLASGNASGIVIAHGTDTLSYTASLLYWLFADAGIPIVLTAADVPPGASSDAPANLRAAVRRAAEGQPGVCVLFGGTVYSPVNLKFQRVNPGEFRNWNMESPVFTGKPMIRYTDLVPETLQGRFEEAINRTHIVRVYPGLRADTLIALMNAGIRYFILELFDTGTANLRETPYSLRRAFEEGARRGVTFFCTSQQEGIVDFSGYVTAHELWKEGAIPMGSLTTESAYTRLIVAQCATTEERDIIRLMEVQV